MLNRYVLQKRKGDFMKTLKNSIYKNIASILASDKKEFKTSQNIVLFSRIISMYPSKSIYCLSAERLISFIEKNVNNISLIIEVMRDEGEDDEIVSTIDMLNKQPTINTSSEVTSLCLILSDYIKYAKILKAKNSFISTLDMLNEDEDPANLKEQIDDLYRISTEMVSAYNTANITSVKHTFDSNDPDGQKNVIAEAKDVNDPNKVLITGIRGLNTLLSPGYLSGCLYIYAALPGNYKSGILLESHVDACRYNEHIKSTTQGKIPISIYISMENTMSQTIRRLWSLLFPAADMSMYTVDEIQQMMESALTEKGFRSVILYYGYREKSTANIANIIRSFNDDTHEVVCLFLDYIKRIRPARTDVAAISSEKSELNAIMNELKLICSQFNIPIISGHQLNRQAAQAVDAIVLNGGYTKTNEVLGRSQVGTALTADVKLNGAA